MLPEHQWRNEIDRRRSLGIPHDSRSEELAKALSDIDFENGDYFEFEFGGDGDNGEEFLYLLDIYFERQGDDESNNSTTIGG